MSEQRVTFSTYTRKCHRVDRDGVRCGRKATGYFTRDCDGRHVNLCNDHARSVRRGSEIRIQLFERSIEPFAKADARELR